MLHKALYVVTSVVSRVKICPLMYFLYKCQACSIIPEKRRLRRSEINVAT